jgi:hypothetical protein
MKESVLSAMPKCFDKWCHNFDDLFSRQVQRQQFRTYLSGLLGESQRKNLSQMVNNIVNSSYNSLRHFLTQAPWDEKAVKERRIKLLDKCRQTKIRKEFRLIVDDSGHRKSAQKTAGVGRQYRGEIGKTDNGVVLVSTHLSDGVKHLPLEVELYQHASSLEGGKENPEFRNKPEIALSLIDQCIQRGDKPEQVLIDAAYGNNAPFWEKWESRELIYLGGIAKNRRVYVQLPGNTLVKYSWEDAAQALPPERFKPVQLDLEQPRTVWVALLEVEIPKLKGSRSIAIQLNAPTWEEATEVDDLITNAPREKVTAEWMVKTDSERNWIEVFYREAKGWLGLKEYQVRDAKSLKRHWILVLSSYSFVLWHRLTGGWRRQWATKPLKTFGDAMAAFRNAIDFRFVRWLADNNDVFAAHKAKSGLIWA